MQVIVNRFHDDPLIDAVFYEHAYLELVLSIDKTVIGVIFDYMYSCLSKQIKSVEHESKVQDISFIETMSNCFSRFEVGF